MSDLMMELPGTVSDVRGTFRGWVMTRKCDDGRWEGWLEFVPIAGAASLVYATPIETRQHDRATVARWASGLSHVYAEGALARATFEQSSQAASRLLLTLQELVEALDRRIPQIERVGEAAITADANRLRACALQRIGELGRKANAPSA